MIKAALITAMDSEFEALSSLYGFKGNAAQKEAIVNGQKILLIKSGIGKVNAALAAARACALKAGVVITTGLAGGIDKGLKQGDVILADKVCYHDVWCGQPNEKGQVQGLPLYYEAPKDLIAKIISAAPTGYFITGLTVTGDKFLTDSSALKAIKDDFTTALAADMESAAVAQACYLAEVPFLSLRIISDVVGQKKQTEEYDNFWHNVPHKAAEMVELVLNSL